MSKRRDVLPGSSGYAEIVNLAEILARHAETLPHQGTDYPAPDGLPRWLRVPVDLVVPGRHQPRTTFDNDSIVSLADSVRENGQMVPARVFANERGLVWRLGRVPPVVPLAAAQRRT